VSVADRLASLTPEQRALFEALRQKQRPATPAAPPPIERVSGPRGVGDWPLTFDQERLWFLHQLAPADSSYNMIAATRLMGELDATALEAALDTVVDRHGAWRTTFPMVDGRPVQRVAPELRLPLPVVDLSALPPETREAAVLGLAGSFIHVHISENDRGTPGTGHVQWDETFRALRQVNYDGWLVIEAFGRALPALAAATRVWRDFFPDRQEVYRHGYGVIRDGWAAA